MVVIPAKPAAATYSGQKSWADMYTEYTRKETGLPLKAQRAFSGQLSCRQTTFMVLELQDCMDVIEQESQLIAERYEIIDTIAKGGMAVVYRGWDFRMDRYVAIKAIRKEDAGRTDPLAGERFLREARAGASVTHPNIVMIYDFIESDSMLYLVMEYVDGINLKKFIKLRNNLPAIFALAIGEQVCSALSALHMRGVIHRDIKPQNILLTADFRARLTDFGIAHVTDNRELTKTGVVLGTADYLSPEQAKGDPLSPASDIYSLGVVLYEIITGEPPFHGVNPISVAMQHASEPFPLIRYLVPDVPYSVEAIIQKTVEKDPDLRYRSAAALARDLQNCRKELVTRTPLSQHARFRYTPDAINSKEPLPPENIWRRLTKRIGLKGGNAEARRLA